MRRGATAWSLILLAAACGCTAGKHKPEATAASSDSDTHRAAIVKDYEAYWTVFLKASDPPSPSYKALGAYVQGVELQRAQSVLTSRLHAGEAMRGTYGHTAAVASVAASTAVVSDCLEVHTKIFDIKTKRLKMTDAAGPFAISADLVLDGNTWKVAEIKPRNTSCATPPSPPAASPRPSTTK